MYTWNDTYFPGGTMLSFLQEFWIGTMRSFSNAINVCLIWAKSLSQHRIVHFSTQALRAFQHTLQISMEMALFLPLKFHIMSQIFLHLLFLLTLCTTTRQQQVHLLLLWIHPHQCQVTINWLFLELGNLDGKGNEIYKFIESFSSPALCYM